MTHPLSLIASMKAIKWVSTSRSSGTALCPAWAAVVCADSKNVASSSFLARSSAEVVSGLPLIAGRVGWLTGKRESFRFELSQRTVSGESVCPRVREVQQRMQETNRSASVGYLGVSGQFMNSNQARTVCLIHQTLWPSNLPSPFFSSSSRACASAPREGKSSKTALTGWGMNWRNSGSREKRS